MKVVITKASRRQFIQRRHLARATKRARLSETDIIEQHNDDIRRSLRRLEIKAWRRLSAARVQLRDCWRLRLGDWQDGPIDLLRALRWRERSAENEAE